MASCNQRTLGRRTGCEIGTVQLDQWHFLGEQRIATPNNQALTLPTGTTIVEIDAEGGVVYYTINGAAASATSGGYVPAEGGRIIGPLDNLTSVRVHGPAATAAHMLYFREAT